MPKVPPHQVEEALNILETWIGQHIRIIETISRSRDIGKHDHHFATRSCFILHLEQVSIAFSGLNLSIYGANQAQYQIAVERLTHIERVNMDELILIEQFEQRMERRTEIRLAEMMKPGSETTSYEE